MQIKLPKRENISPTHRDDPLKYYYMFGIRYFYLKRFKLAINLMNNSRYDRLIDIGFGSGIFLKELSWHCQELYGIDIHSNIDKVEAMLSKENIEATLKQGSIFEIPFEDSYFDCVVCMSVLEHLINLDKAIYEILRVAKSNADIILGFPIRNTITNSFFKMVGYEPKEIHPSSDIDIISAITDHFRFKEMVNFPGYVPKNFSIYMVCRASTSNQES